VIEFVFNDRKKLGQFGQNAFFMCTQIPVNENMSQRVSDKWRKVLSGKKQVYMKCCHALK